MEAAATRRGFRGRVQRGHTASWIVTVSQRPRQVRPQPRGDAGLQGSAGAVRRVAGYS
jgi:hypothetical protein